MNALVAEQPGAVVQHLAQPGCHVASGDPILVVETMKFETVVKAPVAGVVRDLVGLGDVVGVGSFLCVIDTAAES